MVAEYLQPRDGAVAHVAVVLHRGRAAEASPALGEAHRPAAANLSRCVATPLPCAVRDDEARRRTPDELDLERAQPTLDGNDCHGYIMLVRPDRAPVSITITSETARGALAGQAIRQVDVYRKFV
jgi:hypothetical protein